MKKSFLYLAESPTYGRDYSIKVGISDNPHKRLRGIQQIDHLFSLCAIFEYEDKDFPVIAECAVIAKFNHTPMKYMIPTENYSYASVRIGKEYFIGYSKDFIKYIEDFSEENKQKYRRVL